LLTKNFLSKKLGYELRKKKPLVTQVNAFGTVQEACCACFRSKYKWPANAALGATFAPSQTCDTCYATDIYGIPAKEAVVLDIEAPPMSLMQADAATRKAAEDAAIDKAARKAAESAKAKGMSEVDECHDRCSDWQCGITRGGESYHPPMGPDACRLFMEKLGMEHCGGFLGDYFCPTFCGKEGCGGKDAAYTETESKVMAVHEWNWNCASGNAPEDAAEWLKGPVEGEPAHRGPFLMCEEHNGWYCPFEDGPDLKLVAGDEKPTEVDEGDQAVSVGIMSLPIIDAGTSVAASVGL
jgi:hypothetical protein